MSKHTLRLSAITLSCLLLISACKMEFGIEMGFTTDDHPLLDAPADNYSATKYPVVLVHGLYGFDDIFGLEYWYDIPKVLRNGGSEVFVATVSGANSPAVRGEQLIAQLEQYKADSGKDRFHLFGHSLGAPTIRYAAANRPELVVSATSVAGANYGSEAANNDTLDPPLIKLIVGVMGNLLGHTIDLVSQQSFEQNLLAATDAMTVEGAEAFNNLYPQGLAAVFCNGAENDPVNGFSHGINGPYTEIESVNSFDNFANYYSGALSLPNASGPFTINDGNGIGHNVYYYSFGGNQAETRKGDPLEGLHRSVSKLIDGDDDDGFVERCSMHHGWVIKDNYPMNHLDVMNWFIGMRAANSPYPPSMYRAHVHFLKQLEQQQSL
ncbi:MAG: alpha/beta fold hydrolase [Pseudomonadales bacterium]|nr:alpha/beta fold hydrolase [Pseudomonadales bacterium]